MFKHLQWSTDNNGKIIVLINGKRYENAEAVALRDELIEVLAIGTHSVEVGDEC